MNKKVKTITSWLAGAVFLFALAINVKVTLNDPFVLLSDEAMAQTTTTTSTTISCDIIVTPNGNGIGGAYLWEMPCVMPIGKFEAECLNTGDCDDVCMVEDEKDCYD